MARARRMHEFEVREGEDSESQEPLVMMRILTDSDDEPERVFWLRPATARVLGAELLTQGTRLSWGPVRGMPPSIA